MHFLSFDWTGSDAVGLILCSVAALVAHYYVLHGQDLLCTLRMPTTVHVPFEEYETDARDQLLRNTVGAPSPQASMHRRGE